VRHPDYYYSASAGKVRRGRAIFQLGFEHGVWAARDGDVVGQDYDWRRGCLFPAGVVSLAAGNHGHEFGPAIWLACADPATFARSDTSSIAITCDARGTTYIDGSDAGVAITGGAPNAADVDRANAVVAAAVKEITGRACWL
jgi:hypothetical protein